MNIKKVLVCGYNRSEFVVSCLALRVIVGDAKLECVETLEEFRKKIYEYDAICFNCTMPFYTLDIWLSFIPENVFSLCLSWEPVTEENLDIMLKHKVNYILFDLQNEEEFSLCAKAFAENKNFRSQGTFRNKEEFYRDPTVIYEKLSFYQKCAFHYIMSGKSQKDFMYDFGFNAIGTAGTHWQKVLEKYNVHSVIELRNMFR